MQIPPQGWSLYTKNYLHLGLWTSLRVLHSKPHSNPQTYSQSQCDVATSSSLRNTRVVNRNIYIYIYYIFKKGTLQTQTEATQQVKASSDKGIQKQSSQETKGGPTLSTTACVWEKCIEIQSIEGKGKDAFIKSQLKTDVQSCWTPAAQETCPYPCTYPQKECVVSSKALQKKQRSPK